MRGRTSRSSGPPRVIGKKEVDAKKVYFEKWFSALQRERDAEAEEFRTRQARLGITSLRADGLALFDMHAERRGNLFGEHVIRFSSAAREGREEAMPFHRFNQGDVIVVSREDPMRPALECIALDRATFWLSATSRASPPQDLSRGVWRLDKGEDRLTFERCSEAVQVLTRHKPPTQTAVEIEKQKPRLDSVSGLSLDLQPFFISGNSKASLPQLASMPPSDPKIAKAIRNPPPQGFESWQLNESQRKAILGILGRRLSIVRGPPGTGKSSTAIQLIQYFVHILKQTGIVLLATAFTNIGTDNLLEGLLEKKVNALRIGSPVRVREEVRQATIDARCAAHPMAARLERLREEKASPEVIANLQSNIFRSVLQGVEVICATCIGSSFSTLSTFDFPIVIIDESTQATEPASLCPLIKGCKQLVLFGDDFQLGPTVITRDAEASEALGKSFFMRMAESGIEPFVLSTQYRMHPAISEWPSQKFYSGTIADGVTAEQRSTPPGFAWPRPSAPVAFIDVRGGEDETPGGSKSNKAEARVVCTVVQGLISAGGVSPSQIGIIAPYAAQVRLLTDMFRLDCRLQVSNSADTFDERQSQQCADSGILTVHSVDGYQGREKEVIVFSAVRSNGSGDVGFLSDWRRMNVALTRARRGLIVVGDAKTLGNDPFWKEWLAWAASKGFHVTTPEPENRKQSHRPQSPNAEPQSKKPKQHNNHGGN